ncbi:hypothetical protein [Haladaptatus sp. R4]|uniref:hypothetical protein n=1 Tax=Haladaptatus sp. R4 TaxID=1679489 RepID=UPI000AA2161A|nr:hypothetical protein [Haladaptatus sp. R4]
MTEEREALPEESVGEACGTGGAGWDERGRPLAHCVVVSPTPLEVVSDEGASG